jgi:sterol carrier protein 2
VTDIPSSFNTGILSLTGYPLAKLAAERVFKDAAMKPSDVDVVEVHDCFSCNELFMYEALGLCKPGEGKTMVEKAEWKKNKAGADIFTLPLLSAENKTVVVNPSGG